MSTQTSTPQPLAFYVTGGTVPRDAPSYVERQADTLLLEGLRQAQFCYVLTSRQMGKSSLMARTAARLREEGTAVAVLDLTAIGQNLTPEQWYDGLLNLLARALDLEDEMEDFWFAQERLSPLQRWMQALQEVVLKLVPGPVVIFLDEIDAVRSLPFSADEFFAAIRECYNRRVEEPEYGRLSFCLLGVASPSDLIRDTRTTPFNIGHRIELSDFTLEEAAPLAEGLAVAGEAVSASPQALLKRVLYWTGGHPYLTQRLCQAVAEEFAGKVAGAMAGTDLVDRLCGELFLSSSAQERDDNLIFVRERLLRSEADLASLLDLYAQVLRGKRVADDETNLLVSLLRLSGIVRAERGLLKVRNRIYRHVFDRAWVRANMPDAERRRQKRAYRTGLIRASALFGIIVAIIGALALSAIRNAQRANHLLYIADMNLAQQEWDNNNVGHLQELLEETRNSPDRNFEWDYWNRLCHPELLTFTGHKDFVISVAFSPDGRRVLTGCVDGTVKVWDAVTGKELLTLNDGITSAAFSPDGKSILTSDRYSTVSVWDAVTGKELRTFRRFGFGIFQVAFSPDGRRILTGNVDGTARIWDAETGKADLTISGHSGIASVAFSPDGKRILTGNKDRTASVWNALTGKEQLTLRRHALVYAAWVTFAPDGRRIVTGNRSGIIEIWDALNGKNLVTLHIPMGYEVHSTYIGRSIVTIGDSSTVAFSPDSRQILTISSQTAKLWDVITGRELLTFKGHAGYVNSVAFSPDGKHILTGSDDKTARLWDATTDGESITINASSPNTYPIYSVAFSPDGKRILTGNMAGIASLFDIATCKKLVTFNGHLGPIRSVAFSPDGAHVLTGGTDKTARLWDTVTGKEMLLLQGHMREVTSVAFSPDGKRILTGGADAAAKFWDVTTGMQLRTIYVRSGAIEAVAFSPDGRRILTGHADGTATIIDADTGKEILTVKGHLVIPSVAFSPDGKRLITGSFDKTARLWDAVTGQEIFTLRGHSGSVISSVAFSPGGKRLLTSCFDATARLWDADTGREMLILKGYSMADDMRAAAVPYRHRIYTAAFSPDGKHIAIGSEDGTVKIYSAGP